MALLFFDPLDHYASNTDLTRGGWGGTETPSTSGGRFGGGHIPMSGTGTASINFSGSGTTYYLAFAFRQDTTPGSTASNAQMVAFRQSSGANLICEVRKTAALGFNIENATGSQVFAGAAGAYQLNTWHWVEVRLLVDGAAGQLEIRVDGVQVVNLTNQDFDDGAGDLDQIEFQNGTNSGNSRIDDVVVWDGSAETDSPFVNNFLGDMRLIADVPDATTQEQWTRVGGGAANHEAVDDALPGANDGDTTHVDGGVGVVSDIYSFPDLPGPVNAIHAVGSMVELKKSDAGAVAQNVNTKITSGVAQATSPNYTLTTDYTMFRHVAYHDPNTSADWLKAAADAVELELAAEI